jgi:hypothetical protein
MTTEKQSRRSAKTALPDWQDTIADGGLCKPARPCHNAGLPEYLPCTPLTAPRRMRIPRG